MTGRLPAEERLAAEGKPLEALRASEAKFRFAFDAAPMGVFLLDREGRALEYNRYLQRMLGYDDGGLDGVAFATLVHPEDTDRFQADLTELVDGAGDAVTAARRYRRRDGTYVQGSIRASAVRDAQGRFLHAIYLVEDVTEKRAIEARLALADRMASLGTLAAGVSHEINNPLSFIVANLAFVSEALASMTPAPSDLLAALEDTRQGALRVREIVRDLRIFSRHEELQPAAADVVQVLRSSLNLTRNELRHRARLVLDLGDVPRVAGSAHRLGEVFVNLLVNAAQSITEGHASQNEIRVSCGLQPDGRVKVEIADTGRGIAPEHAAHVFDPFFKTPEGGSGPGLGLSVCYGIVKGLGGEISLESRPGHGSAFRVVLPTRAADGGWRPRERLGDAPPPGRPRVLVVDDEPLVARAVERTLSPASDVTSVTSAIAALAALERDRFDAIVCDLMMPEVTGIELFDRLARERPELAPHVVFLTGGAFTPQARAFLARTANRHVSKPFDPEVLRAAVSEVVAASRAPRTADRPGER